MAGGLSAHRNGIRTKWQTVRRPAGRRAPCDQEREPLVQAIRQADGGRTSALGCRVMSGLGQARQSLLQPRWRHFADRVSTARSSSPANKRRPSNRLRRCPRSWSSARGVRVGRIAGGIRGAHTIGVHLSARYTRIAVALDVGSDRGDLDKAPARSYLPFNLEGGLVVRAIRPREIDLRGGYRRRHQVARRGRQAAASTDDRDDVWIGSADEGVILAPSRAISGTDVVVDAACGCLCRNEPAILVAPQVGHRDGQVGAGRVMSSTISSASSVAALGHCREERWP